MCEDMGPRHHRGPPQGMPFLRHLWEGLPLMFGEDGPERPFPPGPHVVKWDGDQVTVLIPVPGLGRDEVELEVKGQFLKVTGHKKGAEVPKETPKEERPPETQAPPEGPEPRGSPGCCGGPQYWHHKFGGAPFWGKHYWARDTFHFYVPVPPGADADGNVKARVEKGLLHVTFQKRPEKKLPVE